MFPNGFEPESLTTKCIIASTNERVDFWNNEIQKLNKSKKEKIYLSHDSIDEGDDPYQFLKNMLTEDVLNRYDASDLPPHELKLKEGDICILRRNVDKLNGLTSNSRVKILELKDKIVSVESIHSSGKK